MALLSDLFSKVTSSLPLLKISKWDVMVKKGQAPKRKTDKGISGIIQRVKNSIEDFVSNTQDAVASIFQGSQDKYETIARFDSFVSFNGSRESQIMQNAIESGSFRSVNKVRKPNTCTVELAKGGYRSEVEACLENLKKVNNSLLLCRIVTPFGIMDNMNMIKLDYSYTRDNGSNLLIAKMTFQEVIYGNVKAGFTKLNLKNVKSPSDAIKESTGTLAAKGRFE